MKPITILFLSNKLISGLRPSVASQSIDNYNKATEVINNICMVLRKITNDLYQ
jgi:hypothetical protein